MKAVRLEPPGFVKRCPELGKRRWNCVYGGRAAAKTWWVAWEIIKACSSGHEDVVIFREYGTDAGKSAFKAVKRLIHERGLTGWDVKERSVRYRKTRSEITTRGLSTGTQEGVKGLEGMTILWVDEAHVISERAWELLRPTLRETGSRGYITFNPRFATDPVWIEFVEMGEDPDVALVHATYRDNPEEPEGSRIERERDRRNRPDRFDHIWEGELDLSGEGRLWSWSQINDNRIDPAAVPELEYVSVGFDPAARAATTSDNTGIVVAGRAAEGGYYVLAARSGQWQPSTAAAELDALFAEHQANVAIVERNTGGDWTMDYLRSALPATLPLREVYAKKGKRLRAEPVQSLYANGEVHHVGTLAALEREMVAFPTDGVHDDLVDALVYAVEGARKLQFSYAEARAAG